MRESIKAVLIRRDGMTADEADELIREAMDQLHAYIEDGDMEGAESVCEEYFNLEPDYMDELIF